LPAKASSAYGAQQPNQQLANNQLWTHKLLPALLLIACCWLAASVVNKGMASAYYFKANYYLELWQRKPDTLTAASWQQAAEAIEKAVELHPTHPHYLLILAKINEWAWYKKIKTADQILVNEQLYKLAIELRPAWPNAYADYAYYLGIVNFRISEAFAELAKAAHYGPYTSEVYQRTLLISASRWSLLNGEQKVQSFKALEQMIKNSYGTYRNALEIANSYKLARPFCIYLKLKNTEFSSETREKIDKDFCGTSTK
jgi:hypothetical protein